MQKVKIKSIRKLDRKLDRYDLTISATHNFFANNILIHNSSLRVGNVKISLKESKIRYYLNKLFSKFDLRLESSKYKDVVGSRKVIKTENLTQQSYYKTNIWQNAYEKHFKGKLRKGEVLYAEIVGWEGDENSSPIMGRYSTEKMGKDFVKQYGKEMIFSYGCAVGTFDVYVYRITLTNGDGYQYDYSWEDVKRRCNEMGVKHVVEVGTVYMKDFERPEDLLTYAESLTDKPSVLDNRHLEEGNCFRIENNLMDLKIYKNKGWLYKVLENIIKLDENFVDTEESN